MVIAIIGVLVALLLPAVQAAREAARRSQCMNNLKQLGIALLLHEGAVGAFPEGVHVWERDASGGHGPSSFGWGGLLLPYLEQSTLGAQYKAIVDSNGNKFPDYNWETAVGTGGAPEAAVLSKTHLSVFMCPSDVMEPINVYYNGSKDPFGKSNYVGIAGAYGAEDARGSNPLLFINPTDLETSPPFNDNHRRIMGGTLGIFGGNLSTEMREIPDGTSNTLMVGERSGLIAAEPDNGSASPAAYWTGAIRARWLNSTLSNVRNNAAFLINGTNKYGTSSLHPGGCHFLKADGSVSYLGEDINGALFEAMGTRAGEEVLADAG